MNIDLHINCVKTKNKNLLLSQLRPKGKSYTLMCEKKTMSCTTFHPPAPISQ